MDFTEIFSIRSPLPGLPLETHLVHGCYMEAARADFVYHGIDQLRKTLPESFHGHMIALAEEIRNCSQVLLDIADRSQMHVSRVPMVLSHLQVVLPCLCRSLRDIMTYYEDKTLSREIRWRKMYNKMTDEAGGLPLPQRFVLYHHYLTLLLQLLTRSLNFDFNTLEILRDRVLALRESRGIRTPPQLQLVRQEPMMLAPIIQDNSVHWAEQIFTLPLPSRTALKHRKESATFPPHCQYGQIPIPADSRSLFRRTFDNDRVSVTAFLDQSTDSPYLLLRSMCYGSTPLFSIRGAHELCISREGSALYLKRWSHSEQCSKYWAVLYFLTWEEMVLFYCSFVALKARNTLTVQIHPDEFKLGREKRLFQAQIIDDDFKHSLIVYEDLETHGLRLHAAVWEGELRQCPVWTAFVTHQCQSPTWLTRRSKHRVLLHDIQLYVFCNKYRQERMRDNPSGAFEIYFWSDQAATRFKELFATIASTPESSETNGGGSS